MAIVSMKKIGVISHRSDFDQLCSRLAELGVVQVSRGEEGAGSSDEVRELEELLSRIDRAAAFLRERLDEPVEKLSVTYDELRHQAGEFDLTGLIEDIFKLRSELEELGSHASGLESRIDSLEPYAAIPYSFREMREFEKVRVLPGFLPGGENPEEAAEERDIDLFHAETLSKTPAGRYVLIINHRSMDADVDEMLGELEFSRLHGSGLEDSPAAELDSAREELREIREGISRLEEKALALREERLPQILALKGFYKMELSKAQLSREAASTESTQYLTGWVKTADFAGLEEELSTESGAAAVREISPEEGESPPVALKNPPVIEAFEVITDLYGRPRQGMVDPTPFIAPFFPIFFGLSLTDAGYGLLLMLISGGFLLFSKAAEGTRKFMRFILYSGAATVIIGAMAGGWFGMDLEAMGGPIANALLSVRIFDPLTDALPFFAMTIMLGSVQTSVGFVISGYIGIREGENVAMKIKGVLISLSWIAVAFGAGIFISNYMIPDFMGRFMALGGNLLKFGALGIVVFSLILDIAGDRKSVV